MVSTTTHAWKYPEITEDWRCLYASLNWVTIGSADGLSPNWCQAITWTNDDLLSPEHLWTKFGEILIKPRNIFKKTHLQISSAKCWPYWFSLNMLGLSQLIMYKDVYIKAKSDTTIIHNSEPLGILLDSLIGPWEMQCSKYLSDRQPKANNKWPGLITFPAFVIYFNYWDDKSFHRADNFSRFISNTGEMW